MKICGIIAEYNPFHNGHAFHLAETRRILGQDTALVCIMSGNYVQRGDLAIMEKYTRAQAAVRGGADLVIELPLGAALSSADNFAWGGIRTLEMLGRIGYLSFGSECGSARMLLQAAQTLDSPSVQRKLKDELQKGCSYPAAAQSALSQLYPQSAALLSSPNNTLGISYCRAITRQHSLIAPLSILRRGAAHDSREPQDVNSSSTYLRQLIARADISACSRLMPSDSYALLTESLKSRTAPTLLSALDAALLAHLRRINAQEFLAFENSNEGFCNRLKKCIYQSASFSAACSAAQTRRYPLARVRRAYLRAFLNLPMAAGLEDPTYLRVLAIGKQGRSLLRLFSKTAAVPLITKPNHEKKLSIDSRLACERDLLADDLYALALPDPCAHIGGSHFRKTPYCLPVDPD